MADSANEYLKRLKDPTSQESRILQGSLVQRIIWETELVKHLQTTNYKLEQIKLREIEEQKEELARLDKQLSDMNFKIPDIEAKQRAAQQAAAAANDLIEMQQRLDQLNEAYVFAKEFKAKLEVTVQESKIKYEKSFDKFIQDVPAHEEKIMNKFLDKLNTSIDLKDENGKVVISKEQVKDMLKEAIKEEEKQEGSLSQKIQKEQAAAQKSDSNFQNFVDANKIKQLTQAHHLHLQVRLVNNLEQLQGKQPKQEDFLALMFSKYAEILNHFNVAATSDTSQNEQLAELNNNVRTLQSQQAVLTNQNNSLKEMDNTRDQLANEIQKKQELLKDRTSQMGPAKGPAV